MKRNEYLAPGFYAIPQTSSSDSAELLQLINIAHHTETDDFDQSAHALFRLVGKDNATTPVLALSWETFSMVFGKTLAPAASLDPEIRNSPIPWDCGNDPKPGFYRHYKHNPEKGPLDYGYEVLGTARAFGQHVVDPLPAFTVYRPLYESAKVYRAGKHYDLRPRIMFLENVLDKKTDTGMYSGPRFIRAKGASIFAKFRRQAKAMYGK